MISIDVKHAAGRWVTVHPRTYAESTRAQFASVPGAKWDADARCYRAPREVAEIVLGNLEKARAAKVVWSVWDAEPLLANGPVTHKLRDYQAHGAQWLCDTVLATTGIHESGAALLADDLGLGKSAQAIRAACALRGIAAFGARTDEPIAVVCPAVVVPHWRVEIAKWGESTAHTPRPKKPIARADWYVLSWDSLRTQGPRLPLTSVVIADELHYSSNGRSQRSKAIRAYLDRHKVRPYLIGLSGTPMQTRPRDLFHPLDLLWPGRWGTFFKFTERYCAGRWEEIPGLEKAVWKCDGASRLDELGKRLERLMLRRTKNSVMMELPPRTRVVVPVELGATAVRALGQSVMRQSGATERSLARTLQLIESHKLKATIELARDVAAAGGKPLIFTMTRAAAREIADTLGTAHVTGEHPAARRRDMLLSGLEHAGCAVATMFSVTEGISLTDFDTAIFCGVDWVPSRLLQAEGRIHRFGQAAPVTIYYMIGLHTADEVIRSTVIERLDHFAAIVGNADNERSLSEALGDSEDDLLLQIVEQVRAFVSETGKGAR